MPLSLLFWLLFVIWLVLGGVASWKASANGYWYGGASLLLALLLFVIGWRIFGFIISG